jgi:hypothetical protein
MEFFNKTPYKSMQKWRTNGVKLKQDQTNKAIKRHINR